MLLQRLCKQIGVSSLICIYISFGVDMKLLIVIVSQTRFFGKNISCRALWRNKHFLGQVRRCIRFYFRVSKNINFLFSGNDFFLIFFIFVITAISELIFTFEKIIITGVRQTNLNFQKHAWKKEKHFIFWAKH